MGELVAAVVVLLPLSDAWRALRGLKYCVPKRIREEFAGDWEEDRAAMEAEGHGRAFCTAVLVGRISFELAAYFKAELKDFVAKIVVGIVRPRF